MLAAAAATADPVAMQTATELTGFKGRRLGPDDEGYEDARRIWNGAIDRRPALIARCADEDDAALALAAGRQAVLEVDPGRDPDGGDCGAAFSVHRVGGLGHHVEALTIKTREPG